MIVTKSAEMEDIAVGISNLRMGMDAQFLSNVKQTAQLIYKDIRSKRFQCIKGMLAE